MKIRHLKWKIESMLTFPTIFLFYATILPINTFFLQGPKLQRRNFKFLHASRDEEDDMKQWVRRSEMIFLFPLKVASMDDLTLLRKGIPTSIVATGVSTKKFIEAVDGSPYCQLMIPLSTFEYTTFAVFLDNNDYDVDYFEYFTKWIKQIRKGSDKAKQSKFILARKGCLIEFSACVNSP